ncbi:MAG: fibronectin type III domain-containing protein [bacterium]|nr:fibronectin type III domain-containing protein [bacterium]
MKRLMISLFIMGLFSNLVFAGTPDKIKQSNITDTQLTISWVSPEAEIGLVKYGVSSLADIAYDDRGSDTVSCIHHVTISGLMPQTTYSYKIVSGKTVSDGFKLTTGHSVIPAGSDLVYGKVFQDGPDGGISVAEAIVYLKLQDYDQQGSGDESALYSILVNSDGYWFVNLVNFRTKDLTKQFRYSPEGDILFIQAEGGNSGSARLKIDTKDDAPAPDLRLRR